MAKQACTTHCVDRMSFNATLERADITYLLRSERHFRDSKRWDDMRACYHPDDNQTLVNISWYVCPSRINTKAESDELMV